MHDSDRGRRRDDVYARRSLAGADLLGLEGIDMTEPLCTVFINKKEGKVLIVDREGGTTIIPLEKWKTLYEHAAE